MAGSNFFALLDDIASLLDDVTLMTKMAAKKTAGVLGDDLALNAQQTTGVRADRELPVVWAVAKGSLKNKAILVPLALIISALVPILVLPLLMLGGLYLCFEGVEKLFHSCTAAKLAKTAHHNVLVSALADPQVDIIAFERNKIKTAVRTDFILSAEIVTITLGQVAGQTLPTQIAVLIGISLIMTVGVYGAVAGIVKLDDLGLFLHQKHGSHWAKKMQRSIGVALIALAPYLMKMLSVAGTAAMFLVGGGIIVHGWPVWHDGGHHIIDNLTKISGIGFVAKTLGPLLLNAVTGVLAGTLVFFVKSTSLFLWKKIKK